MNAAGTFSGVGVALVTLFDDDGELDAPATAQHASRLAEAGVAAIVVAGTTGEAFALTETERAELLGAVRSELVGRIPVLAGTGAASIRQAVRLTRQAVDAGADAVMALSPTGAGDVRPYYEEVGRAAGDVPVLAYHFPAVSPPGIPLEALGDLPAAGIKDSEGSAERLLREIVEWDGAVYTGSTHLVFLAGALGAAGAILAIANLEPELAVAAFGGDPAAQKALVAPQKASSPSPVALKQRMAERFSTSPVCRVS